MAEIDLLVDVGAIVSTGEAVIDFGQLDTDLTIADVADLLGVDAEEVYFAIVKGSANVEAMRDLFEALDETFRKKAKTFDDVTRRAVLYTYWYYRDPDTGLLPPEQALVPRRDVRLPLSTRLATHLEEVRREDAARRANDPEVRFSLGDEVFLLEELDILLESARALERHLLRRSEAYGEAARDLALMQKMEQVLAIQEEEHERRGSSEIGPELVSLGHLAHEVSDPGGLLAVARRELVDEPARRYPREATDAILKVLADPELARLLRLFAEWPTIVPQAAGHRRFSRATLVKLRSAVARATRAVLRTPAGERLVEDHLGPLLEAVLGASGVADRTPEIGDAKVRAAIEAEWRDALEDEKDRSRLPSDSSVLAAIATGATRTAAVSDMVTTLLAVRGPELFARVLSPGRSPAVAGLLVRVVALAASKSVDEEWDLLVTLSKAMDKKDVAARVAALRDADLGAKLGEGPVFVTVSLLANVAVFVFEASKGERPTPQRMFELGAAAIGTAKAGTDAVKLAMTRLAGMSGDQVKLLSATSNALQGAAFVVSAGVTVAKMGDQWEDTDEDGLIVSYVSLCGTAASAVAWVASMEVGASLLGAGVVALGPWLAVAGAALAIGSLVLESYLAGPGPLRIFESIWKHLSEKHADGPLHNQLEVVKHAMRRAEDEDGFTDLTFSGEVHKSDVILRLAGMGFAADEIVVITDLSHARVVPLVG